MSRYVMAALLLAAAPSSVWASTIINAGDVSREVEILEDSKRRTETISPSAMLEKVCPNGCVVTLVGVSDGTYLLEGNERVSIEDGYLYYDGPVANVEQDAAEPN